MNHNIKNSRRAQAQKKPAVSALDPRSLIKKPTASMRADFLAGRPYSEMALHPSLKKNIEKKGYISPTEIQERSLPELLAGRNMVGIASTGTGKTGAFLIPFVERLLADRDQTCLVVVPTRELAMQVRAEFDDLTRGMGFFSSCFIGGTNVGKDVRNAGRKHHLIVGTPGRLVDLADRRALSLRGVSVLVLDEFDRMLDMGFIHDVKTIVSHAASRNQTLLFSATIDPSQEHLVRLFAPDPVMLTVSSGNHSSDNVEQNIVEVGKNENKFDVLHKMLSDDSFEKVILFAETKRTVDKINKQLVKTGIRSDVIHGDKSQNYRSRAIHSFKTGRTRVLVATDVASRGIDIEGVTHVINYQLPMTMDSYIHRIGRTGRAGKTGMAYTFIN